MSSHTDEMYYHFVQRAIDAEERARQLEDQLRSQPQQATEVTSQVPTISRADLNNVDKLRSLFPDQDITKMIIDGAIKITND